MLTNRTILLISPQPWKHLRISKHHYAVELARRGNAVYFLEPPDSAGADGVSVENAADAEGVSIVRYRPSFPYAIRFHARWIFDILMKWESRRIARGLGRSIDIVWSFEFNLFSDLKAFGNPVAIFHPVDPLSEGYQIETGESADLIVTVSEQILKNFNGVGVRSVFVNHGLARPFERVASRPDWWKRGETLRVGFSGNLLRPHLNRETMIGMISSNPDAQFHFWGTSNAGTESTAEAAKFIERLASLANVVLHGEVTTDVLADELVKMDCFVLTYSIDDRESDLSNSHKILEYLSTGRVAVGSLVSTYASRRDLLRMPAELDDASLPALLADTLGRIEEFNSPDLQALRRTFALDNTYSRQVDRIENVLTEVLAG